ncbi:hypothetical protein N7491_007858 [Penicillium cf. griseofulvum]|uniref:Uncharacterized protein n=1 Tax=Penicillium cf. griseofulvum TaxID=2972120 RepID=A0A9W9J5F4_9EURO|nr:hypothetical protein N7472_009113 [Penicillium cf. griseofulvum]KAJ5427416.1 hypothetical protein N7491_007858 [Penicillium cf. griseofulvum]KAJ5431616.1 hypothetical protein N7445_008114 [Penicillium cf. griseofulvum]
MNSLEAGLGRNPIPTRARKSTRYTGPGNDPA